MKRLDKMGTEVLAQMVANPAVFEHMSPAIKSFGATLLLGACALMSSGLAHADNKGNSALRGVLATSVLGGIVLDGNKPQNVQNADCDIQGTSGMKVGGAAAVGAYAGNQMGKGTGQVIMTVLGGFLGGSAAQTSENNRMQRECAKQIEQTNRNNNNYQPANYMHNNAVPTAPVLYQATNRDGNPYYVTVNDSPGIAALSGRRVGTQSLDSDSVASNAFSRSASGLKDAYKSLDAQAVNYMNVSRGGNSNDRLARYALDNAEINAANEAAYQRQDRIANAKANFEAAYTNYATKRALFANIADNASVDGFDLSVHGEMLNYMSPPKSANMTDKNGLPNRYAVLPGYR